MVYFWGRVISPQERKICLSQSRKERKENNFENLSDFAALPALVVVRENLWQNLRLNLVLRSSLLLFPEKLDQTPNSKRV